MAEKAFEDLNRCKQEIAELKDKLNKIDSDKEAAFKKKNEYSKQISKLIKEVRETKKARDEFTKSVKEEKVEREKLNNNIRKKIEEVKKFNKEKGDIQKKFGIKEDPGRIKNQIDRLESVVETEVISFDKEKSIMSEIRSLRKKLEESKKVSGVFEKTNKLSKEIDVAKREAEKIHKKVQSKAKESQDKHEEIIKKSKEVDELKAKEEEAFKVFLKFKKEFNAVNDKLKEKLTEMGKYKGTVHKVKEVKRNKEKKGQEKQLKNKKEEVEDKLARGEKLTTEDILVLQEGA